jgi:hypothetical protein
VKLSNLARRVDGLEESLKTLRAEGNTRIDWNCFTSEEQILFERIRELRDKYAPYNPPDDVLEENHHLFLKGLEILFRRALELFQEASKAYCVIDEKDEAFFKFVFNFRIFWFIHELGRQCKKNRKERELCEKYENDDELERAYDEYFKTVEDKVPLWSPESFENFLRPFFDSRSKKRGKQK